MKGYKFLKDTNQLVLIKKIKEDLSRTHFLELNSYKAKLLLGAGFEHTELIVRQYLFYRAANLNLNKTLLLSFSDSNYKMAYPFPIEWRRVLIKNGVKVNNFYSILLWNRLLVLLWIIGVSSIISNIFYSLYEIFFSKYKSLGRYVYFEDLTKNNLPNLINKGLSTDIISWYAQSNIREIDIDVFCHKVKIDSNVSVNGIPVLALPSAILPLNKVISLIKYCLWGVLATGKAFIGLFNGNWWEPFLLSEASNSAVIRLHDPHRLARHYLFHNSNWIYRPLWTYEAEKHKSRILFYFYSTNIQSFKQPNGYPLQANNWHLINWPYYLVWDKNQSDFVHRAHKSANIRIVGPIEFQASQNVIPELPPNSIAVFDVQPFRDAFYASLGLDFDYYVPEICGKFLVDIDEVLGELGATVVLKGKRDVGSLLHHKYKKLLNKLCISKHFIVIESGNSAKDIIEKSIAVISMPFTSTALIAKELGKPSFYYDPTGLIQKDDRAAHGIQIIVGIEELREVFMTIKNSNFSNEFKL